MTVPITARSTRILVPIRYPITGQSARTLTYAEEVAEECGDGVQLLVLHVNVIQNGDRAREVEIRRAAQAILNRTSFTVVTRRGFLLEETVLDEARTSDVDVIVVGANQAPRWRQLLSRLLRTGPNIVPYLEEHTGADVAVEVVE